MAEPENPHELSLLGGFVFSVGGHALPGISTGSKRLLAFLALRDRDVTRTHVAGTLWTALVPACGRPCLASMVLPAKP